MTDTNENTVPTSGCDAISNEGTCFSYFTSSGINWEDARLQCVSSGYDLATVTSIEENTLMYNTATGSTSCWIGLHDRNNEDTFVWADGSNSTFRNWDSGQPDDYRDNEDCAYPWGRPEWNDGRCTATFSCYFCSTRVNVFGEMIGSTPSPLSDNAILITDTTLYCVTENMNTPEVVWSYVDLSGIRTDLTATTDASTGVSTIQVVTSQPGSYSCEVTEDGGTSRTYTAIMTDTNEYTVPTTGCDAISNEGTCFSYFTSTGVNWTDARVQCVSSGYDLATVISTEENTLMYGTLTGSTSCWIGLNDINGEGTYIWADGSDSIYRNWAPGEPNNLGDEDCVHTYGNPNWNDQECADILTCYFCSTHVNVFGEMIGSTPSPLSDNAILITDTTLYCVTENMNTPEVMWSYVDLSGIRTDLTATTDASTGVSTIQVVTTQPGSYSCEVTEDGGTSRMYTAIMTDTNEYTVPTTGCDAISNEGTCFSYFTSTGVNWTDARVQCVSSGYDLATVISTEENTLMYGTLTGSTSCWIGLNDINGEGTYIWADGSDSIYRNWAPGEPNNLGDEDCVHTYGNPNWNDQECADILTCYFCSTHVNVFGEMIGSTPSPLSDNAILITDTTLYCVTENMNTPEVMWSYVDLAVIRTDLASTTDASTGVSTIQVVTTQPGSYSCEVTENGGLSKMYTAIMETEIMPVITSPIQDIGETLNSLDDYSETLECIGEGNPVPEVYWSTTTNIEDQIGSDSFLMLDSTLLTEPVNVFYCVAVSVVGMDYVTLTYNVMTMPYIMSPTEEITVTMVPIESDTYECTAEGIPKPEVYWSITTDIEDRIGSTSTLTITAEDLIGIVTVFSCVAMNSVGIAITTVTYDVPDIEIEDVFAGIMNELNNSEAITEESANILISNLQETVEISLDDGMVDEDALETTSMILEQIIDKTEGTLSEETTMAITNTLGTVITTANELEQPDTEAGSVSTASTATVIALVTLEKLATRLSEQLLENPGDGVITVKSENLLVISQVVDLTNSTDSEEIIDLPVTTGDDNPVSLKLPIDVAQELAINGRLAISTSIVYHDQQANTPNDGQSYQASDILSITIVGITGKVNLSSQVTLAFDVNSSSEGSNYKCVYLNGDNWVSDGLTTVKESAEVTLCQSFHFTSFAVFVTPYDTQADTAAVILDSFSYILVLVSFISLIISFILFCIAGKAFFKVETNIIYFNYCIAMLLATGIFLFGIDTGTFNRILCMIIAFMLHYTWLAVFTWTLCFGILIMFKLVISVMSTKKIYPYLIVFGWLFPLVIPTITISITHSYYVNESDHCFLNKDGVIWAFIAPILIILSVNAVLLVIAIIKIVYAKCANKNNEHKNIVKDALITALVLTPVLGIPWLFLLLNITIRHIALQYIFVFLNGLMGLVFLLVVVLRNREVHGILKKRKTIGVPTHPSTGTRGTLSSSATSSSQVSSKFRKTAGEKSTMERVKTKELDVEGASNFGFEQSMFQTEESVYSDLDTMKKGAPIFEEPKSKKQWAFGATHKANIYCDASDIPDHPPPMYEDVSNTRLVIDVNTNPVYGTNMLFFQDESVQNESDHISNNPVYGSTPYNPYEAI
ncbi:hypothetical protein LOD99_10021 [Oopsacas minuta]|uniref:Uncharacterized protein n=1 Tax=Oopsacas minuta TaxID=111878 RepID=A0AAV7KNA8_9METZ|nr:hypothetical protein LOD99_10021 [Oopsacas minuta]